MIVKSKIANEQTAAAATTLHSSSNPHRNRVASTKTISNNNDSVAKDFDTVNVNDDRHSMGFAKIQIRLVISLVFGFLPGVSQVPSLASSAVPLVTAAAATTTTGVTDFAQTTATAASSSPYNLELDELSSRRRSMDAARLMLEDYSGKKRARLPDSVKKQMDMQDRRLAICQEFSRDEWDWEQCFYYGTNNGGGVGSGAMYFDGGVFAENNSAAAKTTADAAKPKIPTW